MTTTNIDHLTKRIEQVVQEHIAASRRAAEDAVAGAFAAAWGRPRRLPAPGPTATRRRRTSTELVDLSERLYQAVCARPGESMATLAAELGASARTLHRPMTHLKRQGRIRSVGQRHLTRYFPLAERAVRSA